MKFHVTIDAPGYGTLTYTYASLIAAIRDYRFFLTMCRESEKRDECIPHNVFTLTAFGRELLASR
jgi:hypothetical protein